MVITKIAKSRRQRGRFEVFIEGRPSIHLSETLLTKSGWRTGSMLDDTEIEQCIASDARERANQIAMNLISYRPRSTKEIVDKLTRKGFSKDITSRTVDQLRSLNLLNDASFARMYVRDKLRGKPMGKAMIRNKLREKGIPSEVGDQAIDEYVSDEQEQQAAKALAVRKLRLSRSKFASLDPMTRKRRLIEYLLGRGFSREIASSAVRRIIP
jgi:regulatory protein